MKKKKAAQLCGLLCMTDWEIYCGEQASTGLLQFLRDCHRKTKKKQMLTHLLLFYGAGDEARTRYLHLGKVALYRMSYTRNGHDLL